MALIEGFFKNRVLFAACLAWLLAQVFKVIITLAMTKKLSPERLWGAGGMPSAHSAMVCALTVSLARFDGVTSPVFALSVMFAFVTMYDAMGVRREAGEHARLLNKYLNQLETQNADIDGDGIPDKEYDEIELKEFIGHTPLQVLGGVLLRVRAHEVPLGRLVQRGDLPHRVVQQRDHVRERVPEEPADADRDVDAGSAELGQRDHFQAVDPPGRLVPGGAHAHQRQHLAAVGGKTDVVQSFHTGEIFGDIPKLNYISHFLLPSDLYAASHMTIVSTEIISKRFPDGKSNFCVEKLEILDVLLFLHEIYATFLCMMHNSVMTTEFC